VQGYCCRYCCRPTAHAIDYNFGLSAKVAISDLKSEDIKCIEI
jgi:hypothetical protein